MNQYPECKEMNQYPMHAATVNSMLMRTSVYATKATEGTIAIDASRDTKKIKKESASEATEACRTH